MSEPPDSADPIPRAAEQILPIVYDELRKLAAAQMARERPGHTLDATALVHEAFLRLGGEQTFRSKSDFLRAAAEAMRRILVDQARGRQANKRGGDRQRVELPDVAASLPDSMLLALDEALDDLARHDGRAAELIKLRYFGSSD
jgi:RNA polymerase sigma factor (TIGR02999 family)